MLFLESLCCDTLSSIMESSLLKLPVELHWFIVEYLCGFDEYYDLHSSTTLSQTCTFYRSLLAPSLFQRVTLHNTMSSGNSINAIAQGPCQVLVKELRYETLSLFQARAKRLTLGHIFPESVDMVLSNLWRFSNLQSISVRINDAAGSDERMHFDNVIRLPDDGEDEDTDTEMGGVEHTQYLRVLITKSFEALSCNHKPSFARLEIESIPAKRVSAFSKKKSHTFLGQVKSFGLSMAGPGLGSRSHALNPQYTRFISRLGQCFYTQLKSMEHFTLDSSNGGHLCWHEQSHMRGSSYRVLEALPMQPLKFIEFKGVCLCPGLINFLAARADSLESVVMKTCLASRDGLIAGDVMSWTRSFDAIYNLKPARLSHFEVLDDEPWLGLDPNTKPNKITETAPMVLRILKYYQTPTAL